MSASLANCGMMELEQNIDSNWSLNRAALNSIWISLEARELMCVCVCVGGRRLKWFAPKPEAEFVAN